MYNTGRKKFYESGAKIFFESPDLNLLVQHFKDTIFLPEYNEEYTVNGKGIVNNRISAFLMGKLEDLGIRTHFIKSINMREQLVRRLGMVPIKVLVRNVVAGDLVNKSDLDEGIVLSQPIIEFYCKKEDSAELMINEDHILVFDWLNPWELDEIKRITMRVNDILLGLFLSFGIRLIDLRLEYGREYLDFDSEDSQRIILGDEISIDTCTLWDALTGEKLNKDPKDSPVEEIRGSYLRVAERILASLGGRQFQSAIC